MKTNLNVSQTYKQREVSVKLSVYSRQLSNCCSKNNCTKVTIKILNRLSSQSPEILNVVVIFNLPQYTYVHYSIIVV